MIKIEIIIVIIIIITITILLIYSNQENVIFRPEKLDNNYKFDFEEEFEEIYFQVEPDIKLHGLLFPHNKTIQDKNKTLVIYLHSNYGNLDLWGGLGELYDSDLLIIDYRGYGKSQGKIESQDQLFSDNQYIYDCMKKTYKNIIIEGYSIGSGLACKLASDNDPKLLILNAPYYSLESLILEHYPIIPKFMIRYKLETFEYLKEVNCPIYIYFMAIKISKYQSNIH